MHRRAGLWTFIVALIVRLIPVVAAPHMEIGLDDMFQYDMLARSLIAGHGYRWYAQADLELVTRYTSITLPPDYDPRGVLSSHRAPLYPLFLAGVYALSGLPARFFAARFFQTMLGALLAPGTFLLARRLGRSRRTSHIAALGVALYPTLVVYPMALASENLFWPLAVFCVVAVLNPPAAGRSARSGALAGLLLGAAALTRSIIVGLAPIAAWWLWRKGRWRDAAIMVACFLALTVPWSARNTLLHGRPTCIESGLGYSLYVGYHPQSDGTFHYGISLDLLSILDDAERDARGRQMAWEFIRADPARVPYLAWRKLGFLWGLEKRAPMYFYSNGAIGHLPDGLLAAAFLALGAPLVLLLPAAIAGASRYPWNDAKRLVIMWIGYYVGVHMFILAEERYHLVLIPFMAALAGPPRFRSAWQRAVVAALIALALVNWGGELARDWPQLARLFAPDGHQVYFNY